MKPTEYNKGKKLILGQPMVKENGIRYVYLEKPDGSFRCIGVLMGTINQKGIV